jgi:ABC-2 type transport system ATP-binding protein
MPTNDAVIAANGLSRLFPRKGQVLQGVSFQVPPGSLFGLVGPSGAGKTTLLRLLMNCIQPTAGEAHVLGVETRKLGLAQFARIGYVSEGQQQLEWMTVRALLDYLRPFYATWDDILAERLVQLFDLPLDRTIASLSRGMRMKVSLLASLAYRPRLLVLDEPFSGLDPEVRDAVVEAVLQLAGDEGWSGIVASHDLDEIERLVDRVGYLEEGRLLFARTTADLQAGFRTIDIELTHGGTVPAIPPRTWLSLERSGSALRFVHSAYAGDATERELLERFPGARIESTPMSLRDIFLAIGRRERTPRTS